MNCFIDWTICSTEIWHHSINGLRDEERAVLILQCPVVSWLTVTRVSRRTILRSQTSNSISLMWSKQCIMIWRCFINYIPRYLIYSGDSCIIGIPSLTLCWNGVVVHIIAFALMLLEVPGKAISYHLCFSIYLYMISWIGSIVASITIVWVTALLMLKTPVCIIQQFLDYKPCAVYARKWEFNFGYHYSYYYY